MSKWDHNQVAKEKLVEDFDYEVVENRVMFKGKDQKESSQVTDSGELATRHNQGKVQLSYILEADVAVAGACRVFEFGAVKYARSNWKKGLEPNEVIDSLLRHLTAYQNGEVLDPESGLPHVDHITCNALFLATFGKRDDNS